MLGAIEITPWHWTGFILCIIFFLALDLGVFHRRAHVVKFKEAISWSLLWIALSFCFGLFVAPAVVDGWTKRQTIEFITGYIIEFSLSMDNVFVIALIFAYFRIPAQYQHRVLFWGILGALVMRGVMIVCGAALIQRFQWMLYFFGAFLVFTGFKMLFARGEQIHPEKNFITRTARRLFPITDELHGKHFIVRLGGKNFLTPLALVLLTVETTDLIFALDSIPAIFGVTTRQFIVFTSNVFAILGLRSLYFVLAEAIDYFRYLKVGLSIVLVFIGIKMLIDPHGRPEHWFQLEIPTSVSLLIVAGVIIASVLLSVSKSHRENKAANDRSSGTA